MRIELARVLFAWATILLGLVQLASRATVRPRITDCALFHRYGPVFVSAGNSQLLHPASIYLLPGFWLNPFNVLPPRSTPSRGSNKHQWLHRMVGRVE
jgi:hypothetical protein